MLKEAPVTGRAFKTEEIAADVVFVGGGMSGSCGALTAARAGLRVVLLQDRPVLGGNASSEVRLWVLGATSHMGNNNRWAREGGVIDEILVENMYRNPEGNPLIFDTIVLEKVVSEPNIRLMLNTAVFEVEKDAADPDKITAVRGFCSQNSTMYHVSAPLFVDASGDGALGFLAGAAFRMGAESADEFGEKFAPTKEYGELLGHSLYFYTKDTGRPVKFVPPSYALDDITKIPRFQSFNAKEYGCKLWWIEYGGRLDTVHDTERIKWELWKVVYGVWNYIKNSGNFPEAENLTLEWVGHIPGKRESRRFEGDYILRQQDIVEQTEHYDAVSFGGWSLDLHPADGVFSEKPGCNQWHARGIYGIPYRAMYSRNVKNLFLAGRIISASHVAFASSRVMGTCANGAQAVAIAAKLCIENGWLPRDVAEPERAKLLQQELLKTGQFIPGVRAHDEADLTQKATMKASSQFVLQGLAPDAAPVPLTQGWGQMLPVTAGKVPMLTFWADVTERTALEVELRTSDRPENYTPDVLLGKQVLNLAPGEKQALVLDFEAEVDEARYIFVCFRPNRAVALHTSSARITGILSVTNKFSPEVSNYGVQTPPDDLGVEAFEFWCPQRRPGGRNLAFAAEPALTPSLFAPENVLNGFARPTSQPNAWVADPNDPQPTLTLGWDAPQIIHQVVLSFDTDFDHPMESVLMGHPEREMPFCVREYTICNAAGQAVYHAANNHQSRNTITFEPPLVTDRLVVHLESTHGNTPAALFAVNCYN
jgi:hypothetical protein